MTFNKLFFHKLNFQTIRTTLKLLHNTYTVVVIIHKFFQIEKPIFQLLNSQNTGAPVLGHRRFFSSCPRTMAPFLLSFLSPFPMKKRQGERGHFLSSACLFASPSIYIFVYRAKQYHRCNTGVR